MVADSPVFVGIDVSKEWVDAAVRPQGTARRVNRDREAADGFVLQLSALAPQIVVMLTDRDAVMMNTRQTIAMSYNSQAMVSPVTVEEKAAGMLITAADVVDDTTDQAQLGPMLEKGEETAETTLADAGCHSGSNPEECGRRGQRVVMPESQDRALESPYHKDRFAYDEASDRYRCPEGQWLRFTGTRLTRKTMMRLYRASGAVCRACPAFGVCTRNKRHGRSLDIGPHDAALRRHRAWMSTGEAKQAYRQRKQLVEPVFGIIKEQQQARRFLLRGLPNVAAERTLLATAFNLSALRRMRRAAAGPYSAYRAAQAAIIGPARALLRLIRLCPQPV